MFEITLDVYGEYSNFYDQREVTLDVTFYGPEGVSMTVPGFWDGKESWRVRFTPWVEGEWTYQLVAWVNGFGESAPAAGSFNVVSSDSHGWILPGDQVGPEYSGHYLMHHDGTSFYGIGMAEALNILIDGFNLENGVGLFDNMVAVEQNFVVYWPLYAHSPIANYDDYSHSNMSVIDLVVQDAQANDIKLIFTVWDHPQLRDDTHAWDTGRWESNGFKNLVSLPEFFTDDEAWAWQENFYRYVIARWGYSPAIGMWQTVTEINGTLAYEQTDFWHERVNTYFVENDPYRHPTTASMAGDVDWATGHAAMDAPQVHIYDLEYPVEAASTLAYWTSLMFNRGDKPNWVGEFGVPGNGEYPELFHNSIWAALANGAAMTPAEWNSGGNWARMTDEMNADLVRLNTFVQDLPLAQWDPDLVEVTTSQPEETRAWGLAGEDGGLIWVQDYSLAGLNAKEIRAAQVERSGVEIQVEGLVAGSWTVTPYDTWTGEFLEAVQIECVTGESCAISLPAFLGDIAMRIERD
jgi:hypothetical protein